MGYDMYVVNRDPEEEAAVAAIRACIDAARAAGDPRAAVRGWDEIRVVEKSYFRLNLMGMTQTCNTMFRTGMMHSTPAPEFPDPVRFGVTERMLATWDGERDTLADGPLKEYFAACDRITDAADTAALGIPSHKFGTMDGWLVTPAEIHAALEAYATGPRLPADHPLWWDQWISYLRYAETRGGFRVR